MKKTGLFLTLLLLVTNFVFAGDDFSRSEAFTKRKLLIVLYEESPEEITEVSKSGKPEDVVKYKANISKYNENAKAAFSQYWSDKPQEFMPKSKVDALKNEELENYTVISYYVGQQEGVDFYVFTLGMIYSTVSKKGEKKYFLNERSFNVNIQNEVPSKGDLLFLITKLKMYFDIMPEFDREQLEGLLAKKTLLLNKDNLEMTESEIKEDYPFPFKITSPEEISDLADKADKNSLYLKLDIDAKNLINFMIIECETGKILSRCHITGISKVTINMPSAHSTNMQAAEMARRENRIYTGPSGGAHVGKEIARLYTAKAKLKGTQLKYMSSKKKQQTFFKDLVIY